LVFFRHAQYQILGLFINSGSTLGLTHLGSIELMSSQLSAPAQNGIGLGGGSYFLESLAAQPMTDFGLSGPLRIRKLQPGLDLGFQDPAFSDQIFMRNSNSWSTVPVM
jgi:hypothetical protein